MKCVLGKGLVDYSVVRLHVVGQWISLLVEAGERFSLVRLPEVEEHGLWHGRGFFLFLFFAFGFFLEHNHVFDVG